MSKILPKKRLSTLFFHSAESKTSIELTTYWLILPWQLWTTEKHGWTDEQTHGKRNSFFPFASCNKRTNKYTNKQKINKREADTVFCNSTSNFAVVRLLFPAWLFFRRESDRVKTMKLRTAKGSGIKDDWRITFQSVKSVIGKLAG